MAPIMTPLNQWLAKIFPAQRWRWLEMLIAVILIVLVLLSRFYGLEARVMSHDESEHTYFSWRLAQGSGYQHTPITHGPLQFHLLALTYTIFGDSDATSRFPAAVSGVAALVILLFFRRWLGRWGTLAAMAVMLVSPFMLFYSRYVRNEALILPAALLMFLALFRYFETQDKRWLYLFTAALTAHYLIKETAFLYAVELMLFLGVHLVWDLLTGSWQKEEERLTFLAGSVAFGVGSAAGLISFFRLRASSVGSESFSPGLTLWIELLIAVIGLMMMIYPAVKNYGARLRSEFPALDALIVSLTVTLPQLAAFPAILLGWDPLDYNNQTTMMKTGIVLSVLIALTALIGLLWDWQKWTVIAGIFFIPYTILYTTFFTNLAGLATGLVGSFGYWLTQQEVQRGGQPWYYYLLIQLPIYEYLAAFGSLVAGAIGLRSLANRLSAWLQAKSTDEPTPPAPNFPAAGFLGYWTLISLLSFSYAGERMPWLTIHIALPMILLTGWAFNEFLENLSRLDWLPLSLTGLPIFPLLFGLSAHTAILAAYHNYDYATEFLVYAHGERGVKTVMEKVEELSQETSGGRTMTVAYDVADGSGDSGVAWPFTWYLRNYPNAVSFGPEITRKLSTYPAIIVSDNNWARLAPLVEGRFQQSEHIRMVWPMQDYIGLSWEKIRKALRSPRMRRALWDLWLNRDYSAYGALTDRDFSLDRWQPSDRMRLYVRNDIAYEVWGIGEPSAGEEPVYEALYQEKMITLSAQSLLGKAGSEPGQLQEPRAIALAPDGSLYIADSGNHRVQHLTPAGDLLHIWGSFADLNEESAPGGTFNEPWGIAVGPDGAVFVADTWNHRIQKFTPSGEFIKAWGSFGLADSLTSLWGPRALVVDSRGRLFVADTGNKRILVFSTDGEPLSQIARGGYAPGELDEPVGLALGEEGALYVADTWNHRIQVFQETEPDHFSYQHSWAVDGWYGQSLENKPYLALGPQNQVCTTDPEGYRVLCFNSHGEFLLGWGSYGEGLNQFNLPTALVFLPDGSLWVADSGNARILQFQPPWESAGDQP